MLLDSCENPKLHLNAYWVGQEDVNWKNIHHFEEWIQNSEKVTE